MAEILRRAIKTIGVALREDPKIRTWTEELVTTVEDFTPVWLTFEADSPEAERLREAIDRYDILIRLAQSWIGHTFSIETTSTAEGRLVISLFMYNKPHSDRVTGDEFRFEYKNGQATAAQLDASLHKNRTGKLVPIYNYQKYQTRPYPVTEKDLKLFTTVVDIINEQPGRGG